MHGWLSLGVFTRFHFVAKDSWLEIKLDFRVPHHVMMGSDCVLDWSHVPHLKSAEGEAVLEEQQLRCRVCRRHWQASAFLTLFFFPSEYNKQTASQQTQRQQVGVGAALSNASHESAKCLWNGDKTLNYVFFIWSESGCSKQKNNKQLKPGEKEAPKIALWKGDLQDVSKHMWKLSLGRPWRGKWSSSKEMDEAKHTNMGATWLSSPRPRETDPCGEGSWPALTGTAIY